MRYVAARPDLWGGQALRHSRLYAENAQVVVRNRVTSRIYWQDKLDGAL
jgi:hypothetical protein